MRQVTNEEKLAELQPLTLMDDLFMRIFFMDNIPCVQLMLRIIMDKPDLIVDSVKVQHMLKGAETSRYVRLDIHAVDSNGTHYDCEFQNESAGAIPQRARYNSALLDANILRPKEDYSVLKKRESVVIFITEKDVLGEDEPIYVIDRVIRKSGTPFNDGSHIIYVNGSYKDLSTALGRLVHDFHCVKPDDMIYPALSERAFELKGDRRMGVWEEMETEAHEKGHAEGLAEGIMEASERIARNLLRAGTVALDEIAKACDLSLQRVQELAAGL